MARRPLGSARLFSSLIKPILSVQEVCELLAISEAQFYALKDEGWFDTRGLLKEVEPPLDRRPRYLGAPLERWLSDDGQQRALSARLKDAS